MKKNVASQIIGVQMITAADGTAFTGTVTVLVTKDGGTQTASAGTGPTHEGNGFHTYIPTQAETNADHIGFTFTGTAAIPATLQVYTAFPQTVDNTTKLANIETQIGTAGAGLTAINLPNQTMDITGNLSGSVGSVTGAVGSVTGSVGSVAGNVDGNVTGSAASVIAAVTIDAGSVDAIWDETKTAHSTADSFGVAVKDTLIDTAEIGTAGAGLSNINLPNQTMDIVGSITGNLSGSVGSVTGAVGSVTGNVGGSVGSVTGAVGSVTGAVGSVTGAVGSVTTAVELDATQAFDNTGQTTSLPATVGASVTGSVLDASATAGSFKGDASLSGTNDWYNGSVLVFTGGTLKGIARRITDYAGSTNLFTFTTAFPAAPANSDAFIIIGRID